VRKISVRSTEIETFDKAHVIIPNSYFMAEKVKNWTFRNNVRRVSIPVGVAYGTDPRKVRAELMAVADQHPDVLKIPGPFAMLDGLGASSINFTLYAFVGDLTKAGSVQTELTMAILDAFNKAGIVIPSGTTDVALREMAWLRDIAAEFASRPVERHGANGGSAATDAPPLAAK